VCMYVCMCVCLLFYMHNRTSLIVLLLHSTLMKDKHWATHMHAGVGGFGRVYAGQWRSQDVAVKVLACDDAKHYQVRPCFTAV